MKIEQYILDNSKPSFLVCVSQGSRRGEGHKIIKTKPLKCYECMSILIAYPLSSKTKNSMINWNEERLVLKRKTPIVPNSNSILENGIKEILNDINNLDNVPEDKTYEGEYTLKEIVNIINKNWKNNFITN